MENRTEISLFKEKALLWANQFEVCCFFDSNNYKDPYSQYDFVLAAGANKTLSAESDHAFHSLQKFYETHREWLFGYFSYDLKNETEKLRSENRDNLGFPDLFFFIPEYLIIGQNNQLKVLMGPENILEIIKQTPLVETSRLDKITIKNRLSKKEYLDNVKSLQEHIKRGDIYEVNFCQEFYAEQARIDPVSVFKHLNKLSPTPFAGYFKLYDKYILSATPERFMCKRENRLISQPIKGTAKRSKDPGKDEEIKLDLRNNIKEQSENVMIVDLVRNDLTKSAVKGSVKVDELFGIYSFAQVHQMISTISCTIKPDIHFIEAIKNTFPMGSMTGAPKIKAMELIEQYEETKRGVYSGSFGCISPDGDFDFNVIIRTILYNKTSEYLSFQVGGAITFQSDAEKEYEECLLKASAILEVLKNNKRAD